MDADRQVVLATADQEAVARQFERYDLKSAPVVDADKRLVGVVTVDDVVEVIEEEAEEDLRRLGGVGDETHHRQRALDRAQPLLPGCSSTCGTAMLASSVIKQFDATIEQMVALAVLMPIVASMGGNAGTQTMTVAVRALATRRARPRQRGARRPARGLRRPHQRHRLRRHHGAHRVLLVRLGKLGAGDRRGHGLQLRWRPRWPASSFRSALTQLGFDPAVASGVFVTTVTDVVGFFAFLGLASLWLL